MSSSLVKTQSLPTADSNSCSAFAKSAALTPGGSIAMLLSPLENSAAWCAGSITQETRASSREPSLAAGFATMRACSRWSEARVRSVKKAVFGRHARNGLCRLAERGQQLVVPEWEHVTRQRDESGARRCAVTRAMSRAASKRASMMKCETRAGVREEVRTKRWPRCGPRRPPPSRCRSIVCERSSYPLPL